MDRLAYDMPRVNMNMALPTVYDESLSYGEEIRRVKINLINVINYLNNLIDSGLEQPIKDKLESMALSGELNAIIESVLIYDGGTF